MKRIFFLTVGLLALSLVIVLGQPQSMPLAPNFQQRLQTIVERSKSAENQQPHLTSFNLDFPGGTPAKLVKAIEKAMGRPLNAIISIEDADIQLPPLKMNEVTVPQLFAAVGAASRKTVAVTNPGYPNASQFTTYYGFETEGGAVTDSTIWYFHVEKPTLPSGVISTERVCRFYNLDPYLSRGFTVDDITTAIQTGWKMDGITSPPELNYHKETKLLIASGQPSQLLTIQDVLNSLPATNASVNEFNTMKSQINGLESQVDRLTKKVSALTQAQTARPEEKSGK